MPIRNSKLRAREEERARIENYEKTLKKFNRKNKFKKVDKNHLFNRVFSGHKVNIIRSIDNYKIKSHNNKRQIIDMARHLFCLYNTPLFMFNVWFSEPNFKNWFFTIAKGESLYKKHSKGILTKKETDYFIKKSDNNFFIIENIWRAKILANYGNIKLFNYIARTNLINLYDELTNIEFINQFILFFIRNEMDNFNDFQELCDFISFKYAENNNFSLKHRTINSLIKASNEWHIETSKKKNKNNLSWEGTSIENWEYIEKVKLDNFEYERIWTIDQILKSRDLYEEGRKMRHCVASYEGRCMSGLTAIFTMSCFDYIKGYKKIATIELNINNKKVSQIKGPGNSDVGKKEHTIILKWKNKNFIN